MSIAAFTIAIFLVYRIKGLCAVLLNGHRLILKFLLDIGLQLGTIAIKNYTKSYF